MSDAKLLFDWANDPSVRKTAKNMALITWDTHVKWLQKKLDSLDLTRLFIAMDKDQNLVGQIRFDKDAQTVILDYSICSEYRGKGFGTKILMEGFETISQLWPFEKVVAIVRINNPASQRALLNAGFTLFDHGPIYLKYSKSK